MFVHAPDKNTPLLDHEGETLGKDALMERALGAGQGHIFAWWEDLDERARSELLAQVRSIDFELVQRLVDSLVLHPRAQEPVDLEPAPIIPLPKTKAEKAREREARELGEYTIRQGKVAALVVAGGQGTRLGFSGPKGAFPIGPISAKSLFQIFAERIVAYRRRYEVSIPWYVMTSGDNHRATVSFFETHDYFGVPRQDVVFFQQGTLPAVDRNGKIILEDKGRIFFSPDGHGGTLQALKRSGALEDIMRRGIEELSYFQVDNVLVKVVDPVFIGYHRKERAQMSSKVVRKAYPEEKVGVIGRRGGRLSVIEYSDLPKEDMYARNPDGTLKYWAGSIAIHLLNVGFVERLTGGTLRLPFHRAEKKIPYIDAAGVKHTPESPNGFKFESFIFDALEWAQRSVTMEVARSEEFSPVKNAHGLDSPSTARRDLAELHASWLEQAGVRVPRDAEGRLAVRIEISPLFALDSAELSRKLPPDFRIEGDLLLEEKLS